MDTSSTSYTTASRNCQHLAGSPTPSPTRPPGRLNNRQILAKLHALGVRFVRFSKAKIAFDKRHRTWGLSLDALLRTYDDPSLLVGWIPASVGARVWTAPDGASADQQTAMARTIGALKGGRQVIGETVAKGLGQGALASPRADFVPTKTGPDHTLANAGMRQQLEASIASAYGVSPLWFNPSATAPGVRECKRLAFLNCTLPLSKAIADELSLKLDAPIAIRYLNLGDQSVDVTMRARAAQALGQLGVPPQDALVIAGLDGVLLANEDDDDFRMTPPAIPPVNRIPRTPRGGPLACESPTWWMAR